MPDFDQLKNTVMTSVTEGGALFTKLKGLFDQVGLPVDNKALTHGSWQELWDKFVGGMGGKQKVSNMVKLAATAGSEYLVPGSGKYVGPALAFSNLFGQTKEAFRNGKKPTLPGEWVAIDNGPEKIQTNRSHRELLTAEIDNELISVGFFIQNGAAKDSFMVFNFETKATEERGVDEVIVLPADKQEPLSALPIYGRMREVVMEQHLGKPKGSTLVGAVNVDPGAEVVYLGKPYRVVHAWGNIVKISNKEESRDVDYKLLSRGRQKHTAGWDYGSTPHGPGFTRDSNPAFHANQWVWLTPPRPAAVRDAYAQFDVTRELGVLRLIDGEFFDGYYALDGIRFRRKRAELIPASRSELGWLSLDKDFVRFKDAAVSGEGTRRLRLGRDYLGICLGQVLTMETKTLDYQSFSDEGEVSGKQEVLVAGGPTDPEGGTKDEKEQRAFDSTQAYVGPRNKEGTVTDEGPMYEKAPIVLIAVAVAATLIVMNFGK